MVVENTKHWNRFVDDITFRWKPYDRANTHRFGCFIGCCCSVPKLLFWRYEMKTKLIVSAVLLTLSLPVHAGVYKCNVNGQTVYQQGPCAGQVDTAQPMKILDNGISKDGFDKWVDNADEFRKKSKKEADELRNKFDNVFGENNQYLKYEVLHTTLEPDEIADKVNKAKNFIAYSLKDPVSAMFRNIKLFQVKHIGGIDTFICGEVNAKNSFGGYVGFKTFITYNSRMDSNKIAGGIEDNGRIVSTQVADKWWKYDADDMCLIKGTLIETGETLQ